MNPTPQTWCLLHSRWPQYVVCSHVIAGPAPIAVLNWPTFDSSEDALCAACLDRCELLRPYELAIVCDLCMEQLIIPACGLLPGADEWEGELAAEV